MFIIAGVFIALVVWIFYLFCLPKAKITITSDTQTLWYKTPKSLLALILKQTIPASNNFVLQTKTIEKNRYSQGASHRWKKRWHQGFGQYYYIPTVIIQMASLCSTGTRIYNTLSVAGLQHSLSNEAVSIPKFTGSSSSCKQIAQVQARQRWLLLQVVFRDV